MNDSPGTAMARPSSVEETGLGTTSEFSQELAPTAGAEAARQEVQAAVILAKRFPRNEDESYAKIIKSCKRPTFAADTEYSFPRGGKTVAGASVYLAREFARVWGNIRHGCDIIADSDLERTIRAWAWDLETNVKVTSDVTFKKLIQRKRNNETVWVTPDERDLRELTNKQAAISKRNCLLELLPSDMVEDACNAARNTLKARAKEDPDSLRKTLITSFAELNVPVAGLEKYLGHPIGESSPDELVRLRTVYKSIKDGNSSWAEYLNGTNGNGNEDLAEKTKAKAAAMKQKAADDADAIQGEPVLDDHVADGIHTQPDDSDAALDSQDDIDPVEKLRGNVIAQLEEFPLSRRKDFLAGKTGVSKMTEAELNEFSAFLVTQKD